MSRRVPRTKRRRCDVAVDTGDPALPVTGTGQLEGVRKSTNSKWRATVLVAVHLAIAAHATHFLVAGRTVSPVEPSEAMYTLELGQVNAGFIFLIVALAATLVFGRFVCGWGCHIIALQDLCGWLMKRLGVRPKPFRSRLLIWAPLGWALYMFVWPTFRRLVLESSATFPGFSDHLMTTSFWKTFPGPVFAILTLGTCGFAAVYFLGAKGFCTYGCPYGGLFGVIDRLSPGRIVVNDACEQCGHCTVTCTSNVLIHEEVRLYGKVVDPGCMKCLDCVTVCPKGALSYSFDWPSLFSSTSKRARSRRYSLNMREELLVAAVFVGTTMVFRGLYDGPPLLMSIGLGGITAFLALKLWRVWRRADVSLQSLRLRSSGRLTRSGWIFTSLVALWIAFTAHSALVQWHRARGRTWLNRTEATRAEALSGSFRSRTYSSEHARAVERSLSHFSFADRWGLAGVVEVKLGVAWASLLRDDSANAERALRDALDLAPDQATLHDHMIDFLLARGRGDAAIDAIVAKEAVVELTAQDHFKMGGLLVQVGRSDEALEWYAKSVALEPAAFGSRYNYGGLLRRVERHEEAIEQLEAAASLKPDDADTQVELGLAYMAAGNAASALACFRLAMELDPDSPESRYHLPNLIEQLERSP